jgi:hypothetical protein
MSAVGRILTQGVNPRNVYAARVTLSRRLTGFGSCGVAGRHPFSIAVPSAQTNLRMYPGFWCFAPGSSTVPKSASDLLVAIAKKPFRSGCKIAMIRP